MSAVYGPQLPTNADVDRMGVAALTAAQAAPWPVCQPEIEAFSTTCAAQSAAADRESDAEAWGGREPSASYAEWVAEGQDREAGQ